MTAKNRADIQADINTILADNSTGDISEEDIRGVMETAKDSNLNLLDAVAQVMASTLNGATLSAQTTRTGIEDYSDLATDTTPVSYVGGSGFQPIPNDGLGDQTHVDGVDGIGGLWNPTAQLIDFSDFSAGDSVHIRVGITPDTSSANQEFSVRLRAGIGATEFTVPWTHQYYKSSGLQEALTMTDFVFMMDSNIIDNGALFEISSDNDLDYTVSGFAFLMNVRN